jgi:hypothetical protein
MKRISVPTLLFLSLATPLAAQGAEQDLRINAKKGATAWFKHESKMEQSIDMGGQQMDMGNSVTYTLQVSVKEIDDKGMIVLETKIARIAGAMTIPMMGDVEFDSLDQKAGEAAAEEEDGGMGMPNFDAIGVAMSSLSGTTFIARLDPYGKITSMDNLEKTLETAREKAGRMGAQMLAAQLNAKNFERLAESAFGPRPDKAMAVGGTWERNEDGKSSSMPIQNKMKMTLAKHDDEAFVVTATGTVEKTAGEVKVDAGEGKADDGDDEADAQTKEMLAKMEIKNGKLSGSAKVSRTDSFLLESKSTTTMDLLMPSPMGGEMTINQKMTVTTTRTTAEVAMKKAGASKEAPKEGGK